MANTGSYDDWFGQVPIDERNERSWLSLSLRYWYLGWACSWSRSRSFDGFETSVGAP